jgi:Co/Zn/Cd efflux system component
MNFMGRWNATCPYNQNPMILLIIIGLCIWFVVPIMLNGHVKRKNNKKALSMTCKIIGAVIIVWAIISNFI